MIETQTDALPSFVIRALALNKSIKRRGVSHSAPLVRTNLTQSYFRPKRARRLARPVKPKPKRAAAVPLSGVLVPPPLQMLHPERPYCFGSLGSPSLGIVITPVRPAMYQTSEPAFGPSYLAKR